MITSSFLLVVFLLEVVWYRFHGVDFEQCILYSPFHRYHHSPSNVRKFVSVWWSHSWCFVAPIWFKIRVKKIKFHKKVKRMKKNIICIWWALNCFNGSNGKFYFASSIFKVKIQLPYLWRGCIYSCIFRIYEENWFRTITIYNNFCSPQLTIKCQFQWELSAKNKFLKSEKSNQLAWWWADPETWKLGQKYYSEYTFTNIKVGCLKRRHNIGE